MMPILVPTTATRLSVDEAVDTIGFGRFQVGLIIACGLVQAAEGLEVVLLSVLGPMLRCIWRLTEAEVAFLSSTVFLGMLCGGPVWAVLADKVGRWGTTIVSFATVLYFGLLSTAAPTFVWLLTIRGLVGFGIGGCSIIASGLLSEFIPRSARGTTKLVQFLCWSVGSVFMGGMAIVILPRLSWRYLVGVASIPLFLALFGFRWLMESPRYLLVSKQPMKALEVLNHVARINRRMPLTITLTTISSYQCRIQSLFHPDFLRATILQWCIWFGIGVAYYGSVLVSAEVPYNEIHCLYDTLKLKPSRNVDPSCCHSLALYALTAVVVAAVGEIPALFLNCLLLHCASKRLALCVNSICTAALFVGLVFCVETYARLLILFFLRMFAYAVYCTAYLYTLEAYPGNLRSFGQSCCSAASRIGAIMTPFIAQLVLPKVSTIAALAVYAAVMVGVCVCTIMLPKELPITASDEHGYIKDGSMSEMDMLTYDTFTSK